MRTERRPFRFIYFCCFALIAISIVAWVARDSDEHTEKRSPTQNIDVTSPQKSTSRSRNSGAAETIRTTSVWTSAAAKQSNGVATDSPSGRKNGPTRPAQESSRTANSDSLMKPAAELFRPFVEDDPKKVFLPPTVQFHAAVQSEPVDPQWSPLAADALSNYVSSQYGERFEMPLVDCRQDLCEIQIAGRIGGDSQADMRDIQQTMSLIKQQPWWTTLQFDQETGVVTMSSDGRVLLLWFFSRE